MRKIKPLDALFPKTRQGILATMLVQSEKSWYVSELARRMGIPSSSLQRELQALSTAGILKTHRQGHMVYFQANADSPLFPDLRGLLLKTAGMIDVLADVLKPLAAKIQIAFVYGSVASNSEQSDSDIDLMLIGKLTPVELAVPLRGARDMLGREINPTVYSLEEFSKKKKVKDHFLTRVLDKTKLFVIGNSNGLEKITG